MAGNTRKLKSTKRYHMSAEQTRELSQQLIERFKPFVQSAADSGHSAACVAVDGTDPLSDLGRNVERQAFQTLADNLPPNTMREVYQPYEERSLFLLAINLQTGRVVATLRLIVGAGGIGPPTKAIRDIVEHPEYQPDVGKRVDLQDRWLLSSGSVGSVGRPIPSVSRYALEKAAGVHPGATVLDVSSLARVPDLPARDAGITWTPMLAAALFRLSVHLEVRTIFAFLTTDLLNAIRQLCGAPWRDLASLGPVHFLPDDTFTSQPAYLDIEEFSKTLDQRQGGGGRRALPEVKLYDFAKDPSKANAFALW